MKTGETFICWSSPRGYSWDLLYLQNIFTAQNSKTWGSKIQLYQKHSSATVKIWCGESFLKKNMDQDVIEINSDCGHEHKEWKCRLAVEHEPLQKGESTMIPKMMYSEIQLGEGHLLWTTLYAVIRNVWAKYD